VCWSRSFCCSRWPMSRRCALPHNSFWDLLAHGGILSMPCSLWVILWLGRSSPLPSESITFLCVFWIGSS
jgi:hypothetical protein